MDSNESKKDNFYSITNYAEYVETLLTSGTENSHYAKLICECGAEKTYGKDTPFHSFWCQKYEKPK